MKKNNRKEGADFESLAVKLLEREGYIVKDRNFYCGFGEIDIVAEQQKALVFVEVKARQSLKSGWPAESVDIRKQKRIYKCANYYLYKKRLPENTACRFDVVEIVGGQYRIIQNAF